MKFKVLQRREKDFAAEKVGAVEPSYRNPDKVLHPFERAREYTRALNATKLEKIFAKPFLAALDGHTDTVKSMAKCRSLVAPFITGSCDGELRVWSLSKRRCLRSFRAHQGFIRGITTNNDDTSIFSCGDDKVIKQWRLDLEEDTMQGETEEQGAFGQTVGPFDSGTMDARAIYYGPELVATQTLHASSIVTAVDHHWAKPLLVSTGETVDIWDPHRSTPLQCFEWGTDGLLATKFNPAESSLVAATGKDNTIGLYDLRGQSGLKKVLLKNRTNAVAWNPREPLYFTGANEDSALYTFDMRNLNAPVCMHRDHVQAVTDVDYNPSGREIVSASYDKSIRIFGIADGHSKEVYHAKRMQRIMCVRWSADMNFVMSGSEDTNVRLWKAEAAAKLGTLSDREKQAMAYRKRLREKFQHMKDIRRIARHRHIPKWVKNAAERKRQMREGEKRREDNRRKHSKPGTVPKIVEREKVTRKVVE
jgi:WD repeat and SOF domain-containing protein 1